jgi:hypothetical protein
VTLDAPGALEALLAVEEGGGVLLLSGDPEIGLYDAPGDSSSSDRRKSFSRRFRV